MSHGPQKPPVNNALLGISVIGFCAAFSVVISASPAVAQCPRDLVVLSNPDDPYYALAKDIAASENAPVVHSLEDVVDCQPIFLLWVASPTYLSDAAMIEHGQTMKERSSAISTGIITASTLEGARDLWERRTKVQGKSVFAANAPNPSAHIHEGQITAFDHQQTNTYGLTQQSFEEAL
jgi:hypothetical protein